MLHTRLPVADTFRMYESADPKMMPPSCDITGVAHTPVAPVYTNRSDPSQFKPYTKKLLADMYTVPSFDAKLPDARPDPTEYDHCKAPLDVSWYMTPSRDPTLMFPFNDTLGVPLIIPPVVYVHFTLPVPPSTAYTFLLLDPKYNVPSVPITGAVKLPPTLTVTRMVGAVLVGPAYIDRPVWYVSPPC